MFGCLAIYVKDKIVLILRDKPKNTADNGVWLATTQEHHQSLRREFPNMRSIQLLGKPITGWQVLPADAPDFESAALRACDLVLAGDPRIGKVPGARASKSSKAAGKSPKQIKTSKKHGSTMRGVQHGFESATLRLMTPPNGTGSGGSCFPPIDRVAAGEQESCDGCCARTPPAAIPTRDSTVNAILPTCAAQRLLGLTLLLSRSSRIFISANSFFR
jgi:hypothetical protein